MNNHRGWMGIHKDSSLPYMEGDKFLARRNECDGSCKLGDKEKCYKTRPCIIFFRAHITQSFGGKIRHEIRNVNYWWNDCNSITWSRSHIVRNCSEIYILSLSFYQLDQPERLSEKTSKDDAIV